MSEFQAEAEAPLSTTIDTDATPAASGAGAVPISDGDQPSLRADIEAAFKDEKEAAKPEAKDGEKETPKKDEAIADKEAEKPVAEKEAPEVKEAPVKEVEQPEKAAEAVPEKGDSAVHKEPPKNFLPDSREVWKNVPRVVRRDIETMAREHEERVTQFREAGQRYEAIKPYDDLARSNGIDLTESLRRVSELENLIQSNPLAGLNRILQEAGPRKADGQPISLYEMAKAVVEMGPDGYQRIISQRQQEQQGPSEVDALKEQVSAMQAEMKAAPIIAQFAAKNDRYYELESDIALFLQSGKVPASLSPEDRLAAAYDMAVRINPASSAQARPSAEGEETERRAGDDFSGSKSIRSSPGAVTEEVEDEAKGSEESIRESIRKASRSLIKA